MLEVLVALVIALLALALLFRGTIDGLTLTQRASRYENALERARSHLAALADGGTLAPVDAAGDDGGGYRWRHRISALASDASAPAGRQGIGPRVTLYAVSVRISWGAPGHARSVALQTERVGMAAASGP